MNPEAGRGSETSASTSALRNRRARARHYWVIAILTAAVVHAGGFAMLEIETRRGERAPPQVTRVRWVGDRDGPRASAVDEAIDLFDPAPLFLPTRHNVASQVGTATDGRTPGEIFADYEPRLQFSKEEAPPGLVTLPQGVQTAGAAIARFSRPYFTAFGQRDVPVRRLAARAGMIEVRSAESGEVVLRMNVPVEVAENAPAWPDWTPFEMLVSVEPTGVLGTPLIRAPGSGVEVIDSFFRTYVRSGLRPDLRLPAGYYLVTVGP